jgi:hypothetical protein
METHGASSFLPPHRALIFERAQGTLLIVQEHALEAVYVLI